MRVVSLSLYFGWTPRGVQPIYIFFETCGGSVLDLGGCLRAFCGSMDGDPNWALWLVVVHRAVFGAHGVPMQCASLFLGVGNMMGLMRKLFIPYAYAQTHHRPSRGHGGYIGLPSVAFYAPAVLLASFLMHMH